MQNIKTGKQIEGITQAAMRILMDYQWPGNVRELENAVEHAFVLCSGEHIDIIDLPVEIRNMKYHSAAAPSPSCETSPSVKRKKITPDYLVRVLEESDWNKAEAARKTGYSRASIWKYMKKWKIPLERHQGSENI